MAEPLRRLSILPARTKVLVVDDELMLLVSIQRLLGREHDVKTVSEARRAQAMIEAGERFDLILCDLMMPVMTGIELHQQLARTHPEIAKRMVFLTGGAFTPTARRFLDENGHRCFEKPFDAGQLRQTVRELARRG